MKKRKKYILFILTIFCISTTFADNKLARINDPDGFTNIRSGQGKDFPIIARVDTTDFILCDLNTKSDWIKVVTLDWISKDQVKGFIHKSRIQLIEKLDLKKQRQIIAKVLDEEKKLALRLQTSWQQKDSVTFKRTYKENDIFDEAKYTPILDYLPQYFRITNDTTIIQLLFSTMWADKNTANETPSYTIGKCYIDKPDVILGELRKLEDKEQKEFIISDIQWGLMGHFNVGEDGKSNNKQYKILEAKLDNEKQKPRP